MRLCIVGFGLIGASIAAALKARTEGSVVVAIDRSATIDTEAVRALADVRVASDDEPGVDRELSSADLVVLAAPVSVIAGMIERVLERARVVTDCGSTKRAIAARALGSPYRERLVLGHPLAGGSSAGADEARADLFEGKTWIVCEQGSSEAARASVRALVASLGARVVAMTAEQHDHAVALTSHVPQLLASALVVLSERRGAEAAKGPGFESATRTAGGNPAIWGDIFQSNADEVAAVLRELCGELERVASDLEASQPGAALALLDAARRRARSG